MSKTRKYIHDDATYLVHIGFIRKESTKMHIVTQGQQFSSQQWGFIRVHIITVPDKAQASQLLQIQNLRCGVQSKIAFSHFINRRSVCGTENFADLSKIIVLGPKIGPNEHPQIAISTLVVKECESPTILSKEIGFISLLDWSGGIKAEQISHKSCNYLAVLFMCYRQ